MHFALQLTSRELGFHRLHQAKQAHEHGHDHLWEPELHLLQLHDELKTGGRRNMGKGRGESEW
jgi:hypothetical protein